MADSQDQFDNAVRGAKPPITASPAFPWVVALWFAALLGIGSLILPIALVERASMASGLSGLLPQAAPPLGFTARTLIAFAGVAGGGLLGFVLARKVAGTGKPQEKREARVLSARDDIGDDWFETETAPENAKETTTGRRRALAMEEEERPSDFLNIVPLPGTDDLPETTNDAPQEPVVEMAPAGDEPPLELDVDSELAEDMSAPQKLASDEMRQTPPHSETIPAEEPEFEDDILTDQIFRPVEPAEQDDPAATETSVEEVEAEPARPFDLPTVDAESAPMEVNEAAGEGLVQLVQKLGATLEKHRLWSEEQAAIRAAEKAAQEAAEREAARREAEERLEAEREAAARAAAQAEADAEAEAAVIAAAEAEAAAEEDAEEADVPVPVDFDPAPADDAAEAMAAWFGRSAANEAVADDDEDSDSEIAEIAASFSLPLHSKPFAVNADKVEVTDSGTAQDARDGASPEASPNPFRREAQEFVRIDEPEDEPGSMQPAVLFPGQQPRPAQPSTSAGDNGISGANANQSVTPRPFDPPAGEQAQTTGERSQPRPSNDDNERALREALMNLQRMGK